MGTGTGLLAFYGVTPPVGAKGTMIIIDELRYCEDRHVVLWNGVILGEEVMSLCLVA